MPIGRWITKNRKHVKIKQKLRTGVNGSLQNRARKILNKQAELKNRRRPLEDRKSQLLDEGLRIIEKAPGQDPTRLAPDMQKRLIDINSEVQSINIRLKGIR